MTWEATIPSTGGSSGLAFSQSWVCTTIGTFLGSEQWYLLFWLFVFWSWKKLSSDKKTMWLGQAGFLLLRRAFSTAIHKLPSYFLYRLDFVNKNSLLTLIHTRNTQLSNECRQTFLWQAVYLITWPKNCPNLLSAPCIPYLSKEKEKLNVKYLFFPFLLFLSFHYVLIDSSKILPVFGSISFTDKLLHYLRAYKDMYPVSLRA